MAKKDKLDIFSYVSVINGKEKLEGDYEEQFDRVYNKWMMMKIISNDVKMLEICDKLSRFTEIPDRVHFKCICNHYKKIYGNRVVFFKYARKDKTEEEIQLISDHYDINFNDAVNYREVISDDELKRLKLNKKQNDKLINQKGEVKK